MEPESRNDSSQELDLTVDQRDILQHFEEISGGVDRTRSLELLADVDWDLERAVYNFMGMDDPVRRRDTGNNSTDIPSIDLSPPNQRIVHSSPEHSWFIYGLKFLLFPVTLSYRFFISLTRILFSFLYSDPRTNVTDPVGDVRKFIEFFENKYCSEDEGLLPPFHRGSYGQAIKEAKQNLRYFIVYLHGEAHEDTEPFCKKTLCNPRVLEYLRNDSEVIFWGCDVDSPEGYRVSRVLKENTYPFIGVIGLSLDVFSNSKAMALLGRIEGLQTADSLVSQLTSIISDNSVATSAARIEREEIRVNAEIRKEQDQAYEQSLAADRAKKLERQAKENELEQERIERENQRRREENLEMAYKIRSRKWRQVIDKYQASGDKVKLSIKLPSSKRITKDFGLDHSVRLLHYLIISEDEELKNFSVKSNFPQREISCHPADGSDIEDYLDLLKDESVDESKLESTGSTYDSWKPSPSEELKSFRENGLMQPEILMVIDNDA